MQTTPVIQTYVPDYIRSLVPYLPGKPIEETQREFKIKRVVKLASNENPLGPSPKAVKAMREAITDLHRYPDGSAYGLKRTLAQMLDVTSSSIITGNGSNEIIDFLIRTYCVAGDSVVTSKAAFIAYKICAQIQGVKTIETPMTADLRFDLPAILRAVKADERARIVFIANPNNPTGTYVTTAETEAFLQGLKKIRGGSVIVALDYAYWEYVTKKDLPDPIALMKKYPNVLVLRTFSKVYGLAGIRVGYGVGAPELVANMEKVRQPFNMNSLALSAAQAALGDRAFVEKARKCNQKGMKFWEKQLQGLRIPYWESQGNFILADVQKGAGMSGGEVYSACLRKGVIFRPVTNYGLSQALRISIGTDEENKIAAKELALALSEGAAPVGKLGRK